MARFVPQTQYPQPQDQTKMSRGYDRPQPNTAFAKLFEGLGDTLSAGIQAKDETIKQNLEKEAYEGIDPIRDAAGAGLTPDELSPAVPQQPRQKTSLLTDEAGDVLPPVVASQSQRLAKLYKAYQENPNHQSHYYSQFAQRVRDLRTKYPG